MTFDFYIRGDNVSKGIIQKNCMIFISTIHDKYQKNTVHKDLFGVSYHQKYIVSFFILSLYPKVVEFMLKDTYLEILEIRILIQDIFLLSNKIYAVFSCCLLRCITKVLILLDIEKFSTQL